MPARCDTIGIAVKTLSTKFAAKPSIDDGGYAHPCLTSLIRFSMTCSPQYPYRCLIKGSSPTRAHFHCWYMRGTQNTRLAVRTDATP